LFKPESYKGKGKQYFKGDMTNEMLTFQKDATIAITFVEGYIKSLLGPNTPDDIFNNIMELAIKGNTATDSARFQAQSEEVKKRMRQITKQE
jgi:hypothetical protein